MLRARPFRSPHHTISHAGLVGGGNWPHPGEISLAHRGVLSGRTARVWDPRVLEVLRQPIEDKVVTISRAQGSLTFPANFQLVAAMNPCPCGYYGDPIKPCTCSNMVVTKYQKRISRSTAGPDRHPHRGAAGGVRKALLGPAGRSQRDGAGAVRRRGRGNGNVLAMQVPGTFKVPGTYPISLATPTCARRRCANSAVP